MAGDYPQEIWFVPIVILAVLGGVAFIDARTGRVPDLPVIGTFFLCFFALAFFGGWLAAGEKLLYALSALALLRLISLIYITMFNQDPLGFGDAKWTALAVLGFGAKPVVIAWFVGAWLGLFWIAVRKVWHRFMTSREEQAYVHFAPFLFIGLIVGIFLSV